MKTIIIRTWRGHVTEVYSDDKDVKVIIIDDEDDPPLDFEFPPHQNY